MGSVLGGRRSRHVMSAFVCGLDVHKDSTYATNLDPDGKVVNQTRMNNERVLSYLSSFNVDRVCMESSNQVILVTHSPYLVDAPRLQNTWRFATKDGRTAVLHIGRTIDELRKLDDQMISFLLGNPEARSLLFSRGAILVEGSSDKVVVEMMDRYLSLREQDANIEGNEWTVIAVGGKRSLGTFIRL